MLSAGGTARRLLERGSNDSGFVAINARGWRSSSRAVSWSANARETGFGEISDRGSGRFVGITGQSLPNLIVCRISCRSGPILPSFRREDHAPLRLELQVACIDEKLAVLTR